MLPTCVVAQGKGLCHTPMLATGTWVEKYEPFLSSLPPERLSQKALEQSHIARPSVKA